MESFELIEFLYFYVVLHLQVKSYIYE